MDDVGDFIELYNKILVLEGKMRFLLVDSDEVVVCCSLFDFLL